MLCVALRRWWRNLLCGRLWCKWACRGPLTLRPEKIAEEHDRQTDLDGCVLARNKSSMAASVSSLQLEWLWGDGKWKESGAKLGCKNETCKDSETAWVRGSGASRRDCWPKQARIEHNIIGQITEASITCILGITIASQPVNTSPHSPMLVKWHLKPYAVSAPPRFR